MAILSPLFLALTAASPIFKGKLADTDTRWEVISASVDDRTNEERDPNSDKYISKSRYSSISTFISNDSRNLPEYNNIKLPDNHKIKDFTKEQAKNYNFDLDEKLINHLSYIFSRDALVIFDQKINVNNK